MVLHYNNLTIILYFTACATFGTCLTLSSWSTVSLEDVANASGDDSLRWFQLYVYEDKTLTRSLIKRAETSGYKALVVTVDTVVASTRIGYIWDRMTRNRQATYPNFTSCYNWDVQPELDPSLSWETIDWIRGITKLPVLLKGILTREDAKEALKNGVQGIVVSNHGGRQLDGTPATVSDF